MIKRIESEQDMARAAKHLKNADPILAAIIKDTERYRLKRGASHFEFLVGTVVSQLLSTKAAATIFGRLKTALNGQPFNHQAMAKISDDQILSAGLSRAKLKCIRTICTALETGELSFRKLSRMEDGPAMDYMTAIKGIGPWTARIFLMFDLKRADLFAAGDKGLETAIYLLYGTGKKKLDLEKIAAPWSPYRTVACWYLWRHLHSVRAEKAKLGD